MEVRTDVMSRTFQDSVADGKTAHEIRYDTPFRGPIIPSGAYIYIYIFIIQFPQEQEQASSIQLKSPQKHVIGSLSKRRAA